MSNSAERKADTADQSSGSARASHTPGPWKREACEDSPWGIVRIAPHRFITIQGRSWQEAEANASLIAAAPELLAALEAITCLSVNGKQLCFRSANDIPMGMQPKLERIVRAAIKKARGE